MAVSSQSTSPAVVYALLTPRGTATAQRRPGIVLRVVAAVVMISFRIVTSGAPKHNKG